MTLKRVMSLFLGVMEGPTSIATLSYGTLFTILAQYTRRCGYNPVWASSTHIQSFVEIGPERSEIWKFDL